MEARTAPTAQGPPGMPCRLRKITRQHGAPDIFPCPRSLPLSASRWFPIRFRRPRCRCAAPLPAEDFPQAEKSPLPVRDGGFRFRQGAAD